MQKCVCFSAHCVSFCVYCTKVHIQNSSKMQRASANQLFVSNENTVHWTKLRMTIVYLNNAPHFQVRIFCTHSGFVICEFAFSLHLLFLGSTSSFPISLLGPCIHGIRMTIDLGEIFCMRKLCFLANESHLLNSFDI